MKHVSLLVAFLFAFLPLFSQKNLQKNHSTLQAGPMIGYCEYREAVIWIQTQKEAEVYIMYTEKDKPETMFRTENYKTKKESVYTAHILLDELLPGRTYAYTLYVDGHKMSFPYPTEIKTLVDWKFRSDPPPFTVAFGSCTYINESSTDRPGSPYGGDYRIFNSIHQKKPDLMLWGGDNTYLRPSDWGTATGFAHRYTHTRSCEELQPLLAACPQLAVWDDHDFGPNDSNGSFVLNPVAHDMFRHFWSNPPFINFPEGRSITTHFEMNGVDFFFLDNRSFRTPYFENPEDRKMLGKNQIDWLVQNLKFSQSTFKIVMCGSQMLSNATIFENFAQFPKERDYLLKRLEEENIQGVIFLTGDRHHSEISKLINSKGNVFFDITSSPLTSGAGEKSRENEPNEWRVPGTFIQKRNFALLSFTGGEKTRQLAVTYYDSDGNQLVEYQIKASDLRVKN